jgi:[protein-PII] uridylyltransferase
MNIKELRKNYLKNRSELEKEYLARSDPGEFLARHSALLDDLIKAAIQPFLNELDFAIIAIGGYGRREMLPHSDVDLLVVHNCSDSGKVKQTISPLITTLWDLIEDVGHQVWSLNDLVQQDIKDNYEFVLALRDGRYLAGDRKIAAGVMEKIFPEVFHGGKEFFIDIIHSEVDKRYSRQKFTIFHLEPDIKESPGGLRDHLAAGWLEDLVGEPAYFKHSREEVSAAHEFMLGLRIFLHILSGRHNNKLSIDQQEKISFMGSPEAVEPRSHDDIRAAIEVFMKRYYLSLRICHYSIMEIHIILRVTHMME